MPEYTYFCYKCNKEFDIIQGMNELAFAFCVYCDEITQHRLPQPFNVINKTPATLGSLAEENRKRLGETLCQEKTAKYKEDMRLASDFHGKIPDGSSIIERTEPKRPFWRPDMAAPDTALLKANPEQINNYVMTGKRPIGTF